MQREALEARLVFLDAPVERRVGRPLVAPENLAGCTFGGWCVVGAPELVPRARASATWRYPSICVWCGHEHKVLRQNLLKAPAPRGCSSCSNMAPTRRAGRLDARNVPFRTE